MSKTSSKGSLLLATHLRELNNSLFFSKTIVTVYLTHTHTCSWIFQMAELKLFKHFAKHMHFCPKSSCFRKSTPVPQADLILTLLESCRMSMDQKLIIEFPVYISRPLIFCSSPRSTKLLRQKFQLC